MYDTTTQLMMVRDRHESVQRSARPGPARGDGRHPLAGFLQAVAHRFTTRPPSPGHAAPPQPCPASLAT